MEVVGGGEDVRRVEGAEKLSILESLSRWRE